MLDDFGLLPGILKNIVFGFPPTRAVIDRRRLRDGYNAASSAPEYVERVYSGHRAAIEKKRSIVGSRVLEIGPGGNLAVAAMFVRDGASEATCIDVEPWLGDVSSLYAGLGLKETLSRVRYVQPCAIENAPFEDEAFDVIFSHACFQSFADPDGAIKSVARLLAPGGATTHQIDLRSSGSARQPLDFLRPSDRMWSLATSHRPSARNRWRAPEFVEAFTASGLEIFEETVTERIEITEAERGGFAPRFRRMSLESLGTLGLFIGAWKPPRRTPEAS